MEHFVDFVRASDGAAADFDAIADESESVDVGKLATVRGSNLDEGALGLEQGDVTLERHLSAGNGGDDQVKSAAVVLCPVLIVVGSDVSVGTELEDLVLLACLTGNADNLVSSERLGEEDTEMAETTNTNDTDLSSVRLCL